MECKHWLIASHLYLFAVSQLIPSATPPQKKNNSQFGASQHTKTKHAKKQKQKKAGAAPREDIAGLKPPEPAGHGSHGSHVAGDSAVGLRASGHLGWEGHHDTRLASKQAAENICFEGQRSFEGGKKKRKKKASCGDWWVLKARGEHGHFTVRAISRVGCRLSNLPESLISTRQLARLGGLGDHVCNQLGRGRKTPNRIHDANLLRTRTSG